jgi:predicted 3-demethylubiquinone-9 3-methyltransferase (glyoxalase superfamily)
MLKAYKTREITAVQESQSGIRNTLFSLINHKSFNSAGSVSFMYGNNNKEALNRYFNELMGYAAVTQECLSALRIIKKKAVDLIGYFKTRYKFK